MANVTDKVAAIRQAVYGEEVRESLASGIEAINAETVSTTARQVVVDGQESTRLENEVSRVDEEILRVTAEDGRVSDFDNIKTEYDTYKGVMIAESNVAALQDNININSSALANNSTKLPTTSDLKFDGSDTTLRLKQWLGDAFTNNKALFLPNDINVDSTYFNQFGTEIQGKGAIMRDGKFKVNSSLRNKGNVFGLEYAFAFQNLVRNNVVTNDWVTSPIKMVFSGPSTIAGDSVESPSFFIDKCAQSIIFNSTGYLLNYYNRGHSGKNTQDWLNLYLDEDIALNPSVYVLEWGVNDGSSYTLATRLATYLSNMRIGLKRIRDNPTTNKTTIVLMTPCTTNDYLYNREYKWHDQINAGLREIAREYKCLFIDNYALWQDASYWQDKPYPENLDIGIHPLGIFNVNRAGVIVDALLPNGFKAMHQVSNSTVVWTSLGLGNGWVNEGGLWQTARYSKDAHGVVHLEGRITGGTIASNGSCGQLPITCRPKASHQFTFGGNVIRIGADGYVICYSGSGSFDLTNINFSIL